MPHAGESCGSDSPASTTPHRNYRLAAEPPRRPARLNTTKGRSKRRPQPAERAMLDAFDRRLVYHKASDRLSISGTLTEAVTAVLRTHLACADRHNSGGGTRTHNFEVNSFALCQLSYPGPYLCYPGRSFALSSASSGMDIVPSSTSAWQLEHRSTHFCASTRRLSRTIATPGNSRAHRARNRPLRGERSASSQSRTPPAWPLPPGRICVFHDHCASSARSERAGAAP
jgi:hypothetical protein